VLGVRLKNACPFFIFGDKFKIKILKKVCMGKDLARHKTPEEQELELKQADLSG